MSTLEVVKRQWKMDECWEIIPSPTKKRKIQKINEKYEIGTVIKGSEVRALNMDGKELKEFQIGKTGNNKESYYFACRNRPEGVVCKVFVCNWLDIPP